LSFLLGCGGSSPSKSTKTTEVNTSTVSDYTCGSLTENEQCITLSIPDNYSNERHFILSKPEAIEEERPIFIVLHGSGWRADKTLERFSLREFVKENNFIGAYPNSIVREDGVATWNAHNDTYLIPFVDDVNFIEEMIKTVVDEHNGDAKRVYLFGWSNGGFMSNRLACEIPDFISAIYTLAGNLRMELNSCSLAGNVAIHHLHPTGDPTVSFYGDDTKGYISAEAAINRWVEFNQCDLTPIISEPFDLTADEVGDESITYFYQNCNAETNFTVINGSDHGPDFHNEVLHQQLKEFFQKS